VHDFEILNIMDDLDESVFRNQLNEWSPKREDKKNPALKRDIF